MEFYKILPELFVLSMACIILLVDLYYRQKRLLLTYTLTQATLIGATILSVMQLNAPTIFAFDGQFIRDQLSTVLEITIYVISFMIFMFSRDYILDRGNMGRGEYYVLGLFSILGMMILVSAHSLLTIYLGLELLSLPLYAMVAMHRDSDEATEAAMKFFVMGALSSGMLLYGMSMVFGAANSLDITTISQAMSNGGNNTIYVLGLIFIVAGVIFKLGGAPFHMWVPDVFEGAPNAVTLFVAAAPKLAGFGMAIRLLVETFPTLEVQWQPLLILVAIVSMAVGNILAITQSNIKRMLAYSSISHIGYVMLGLIAGTANGYAAAMFYMISYVFMTTAGFAVLILLSRQGFECEKISDLQGLNTRNPWLALMMLITMFSMAGIPPLIGFFAKLGVLEALIDVHMVWLAVVAIIFAIIGLYYYLRVVKVMYFDRPTQADPVLYNADARAMISINGLILLFFGLFPGALFTLCHFVFV